MNNFTIDNYDKLKKIANFIGDPSDLTTESDTIVAAINEIAASSGSGAPVVVGTFSDNAHFSGFKDIEIDYDNTKYPIAALIYIDPSYIYSGETRTKDIAIYSIIKQTPNTAPTYTTLTDDNRGLIVSSIKGSGYTVTPSYGGNVQAYNPTPGQPDSSGIGAAQFKSNNILSVYYKGWTTNAGFTADGVTYTYIILYNE